MHTLRSSESQSSQSLCFERSMFNDVFSLFSQRQSKNPVVVTALRSASLRVDQQDSQKNSMISLDSSFFQTLSDATAGKTPLRAFFGMMKSCVESVRVLHLHQSTVNNLLEESPHRERLLEVLRSSVNSKLSSKRGKKNALPQSFQHLLNNGELDQFQYNAESIALTLLNKELGERYSELNLDDLSDSEHELRYQQLLTQVSVQLLVHFKLHDERSLWEMVRKSEFAPENAQKTRVHHVFDTFVKVLEQAKGNVLLEASGDLESSSLKTLSRDVPLLRSVFSRLESLVPVETFKSVMEEYDLEYEGGELALKNDLAAADSFNDKRQVLKRVLPHELAHELETVLRYDLVFEKKNVESVVNAFLSNEFVKYVEQSSLEDVVETVVRMLTEPDFHFVITVAIGGTHDALNARVPAYVVASARLFEDLAKVQTSLLQQGVRMSLPTLRLFSGHHAAVSANDMDPYLTQARADSVLDFMQHYLKTYHPLVADCTVVTQDSEGLYDTEEMKLMEDLMQIDDDVLSSLLHDLDGMGDNHAVGEASPQSAFYAAIHPFLFGDYVNGDLQRHVQLFGDERVPDALLSLGGSPERRFNRCRKALMQVLMCDSEETLLNRLSHADLVDRVLSVRSHLRLLPSVRMVSFSGRIPVYYDGQDEKGQDLTVSGLANGVQVSRFSKAVYEDFEVLLKDLDAQFLSQDKLQSRMKSVLSVLRVKSSFLKGYLKSLSELDDAQFDHFFELCQLLPREDLHKEKLSNFLSENLELSSQKDPFGSWERFTSFAKSYGLVNGYGKQKSSEREPSLNSHS